MRMRVFESIHNHMSKCVPCREKLAKVLHHAQTTELEEMQDFIKYYLTEVKGHDKK